MQGKSIQRLCFRPQPLLRCSCRQSSGTQQHSRLLESSNRHKSRATPPWARVMLPSLLEGRSSLLSSRAGEPATQMLARTFYTRHLGPPGLPCQRKETSRIRACHPLCLQANNARTSILAVGMLPHMATALRCRHWVRLSRCAKARGQYPLSCLILISSNRHSTKTNVVALHPRQVVSGVASYSLAGTCGDPAFWSLHSPSGKTSLPSVFRLKRPGNVCVAARMSVSEHYMLCDL